MNRREKLRKSLENKAKSFWHDFNQRKEDYLERNLVEIMKFTTHSEEDVRESVKKSKLTEDEIEQVVENSSIAGLNVMGSKKEGEYTRYDIVLETLEEFNLEYSCRECLLNYFNDPDFTSNSVKNPHFQTKKVMLKHEVHAINWLRMCITSKIPLGGPPIPFFSSPEEEAAYERDCKKVSDYYEQEREAERPRPEGDYAINELMKQELNSNLKGL